MRLNHRAAILTVAGCALAGGVGAKLTDGRTVFDGLLYDGALRLRASTIPADKGVEGGPVAVVALDARSLAAPELVAYPRVLLAPIWAELVTGLSDAGASAITFDLLLSYSANRFLKDYDKPFLMALARNRQRIVLGRTAKALPARPYLGALRFDSGALGLLELAADGDGVYRRVPMRHPTLEGEDDIPGLALSALRRAGVEAPMDEVLLAPTRHLETAIPAYALIDVLRCARTAPGTLESAFKGRVVFIGGTLVDEDRKFPAGRFRAPDPANRSAEAAACPPAPLGPSAPHSRTVPGVFLHAAAARAVLSGELTEMLPSGAGTAITALSAMAGALIGFAFMPWIAVAAALFLGAALWGVEVLLLGQGTWFAAGPALLALAVSVMVAYVVRYLVEDRRSRFLRSAFAQYLSPPLVAELASDPARLELGGETRRMTFLFCDVRDFTALSERYRENPHALTRLINRLLTSMTEEILQRGGTIDKYIGDCIMAFWNAPLTDEAHARHACEAALAMRDRLGVLNAQLGAEAEAEGRVHASLRIGIGVNTGVCVVGNMGSDQRFDYTVLGDAVNLASRLEGQSKIYGVTIVLGQETQAEAGDLAALELDVVAVKGRAEAVRIHTLLGDGAVAGGASFTELARHHRAMLAAYRRQDWAAARVALGTCRRLNHGLDGLYALYEARIAAFEAEPPGPDWSGVFVAPTK